MELATIGYEKAPLPEVIGRLQAAGVELLVDVRAVAASRRAGFSKTMLAATLAAHGIDYLHLRALGTPKAGRLAARAGRHAEMRAIFEQHLASAEAQLQLAALRELVAQRRVALLCYEAQAAHCHRAVLAERLQAELGCTVTDL